MTFTMNQTWEYIDEKASHNNFCPHQSVNRREEMWLDCKGDAMGSTGCHGICRTIHMMDMGGKLSRENDI